MENENVCINCLTNLYKNQNLLWADGKKKPCQKSIEYKKGKNLTLYVYIHSPDC